MRLNTERRPLHRQTDKRATAWLRSGCRGSRLGSTRTPPPGCWPGPPAGQPAAPTGRRSAGTAPASPAASSATGVGSRASLQGPVVRAVHADRQARRRPRRRHRPDQPGVAAAAAVEHAHEHGQAERRPALAAQPAGLQLLADLATWPIPLTHQALQTLPNWRAVAYLRDLRDLFMACGVLPAVDSSSSTPMPGSTSASPPSTAPASRTLGSCASSPSDSRSPGCAPKSEPGPSPRRFGGSPASSSPRPRSSSPGSMRAAAAQPRSSRPTSTPGTPPNVGRQTHRCSVATRLELLRP
jgi:hypothetical protein